MAYVTSATTKGGRNGRAMLDNGALALAMAAPMEIGGTGDGHNPEQLFALGYSSLLRPGDHADLEKIRPRRPSCAGDLRGHAGSEGRRLRSRHRTQGFHTWRRQGK